jgi:hypothetical protein
MSQVYSVRVNMAKMTGKRIKRVDERGFVKPNLDAILFQKKIVAQRKMVVEMVTFHYQVYIVR